MLARTKQRKVIRKIEVGKAGFLQIQERVLPRIHINGVNRLRIIQQIIQGITTRAGNHHDFAVLIECQHLSVTTGVLPTSIINKVVLMYQAKEPVLKMVDVFHG